MIVRPARVAEIDKVLPLCEHFRQLSPTRLRLDPEYFATTWRALIESGKGVIFLLEDKSRIVGAIAAVAYPEPYAGEQVCQEFFWWTEPSHRGRGLQLYRALEAWARAQKCVDIRMGHLTDVMASKLARFFEHEGFEAIEVLYSKRMV